MSFIDRTPLLISRKQPFIDWANSLLGDDGPVLTVELARRRDVYLAESTEMEPVLDAVLDSCGQDIFEEELFGWMEDESGWPAERTRQMFHEWFDVELAGSVIDLVPEDPLTEEDMEIAQLEDALHRCAWCDHELGEEEGRSVGFKLADPERLSNREGYVFLLSIDKARAVIGIVTLPDSAPRREGHDLMYRACSRNCERQLRKAVPPALRRRFADS